MSLGKGYVKSPTGSKSSTATSGSPVATLTKTGSGASRRTSTTAGSTGSSNGISTDPDETSVRSERTNGEESSISGISRVKQTAMSINAKSTPTKASTPSATSSSRPAASTSNSLQKRSTSPVLPQGVRSKLISAPRSVSPKMKMDTDIASLVSSDTEDDLDALIRADKEPQSPATNTTMSSELDSTPVKAASTRRISSKPTPATPTKPVVSTPLKPPISRVIPKIDTSAEVVTKTTSSSASPSNAETQKQSLKTPTKSPQTNAASGSKPPVTQVSKITASSLKVRASSASRSQTISAAKTQPPPAPSSTRSPKATLSKDLTESQLQVRASNLSLKPTQPSLSGNATTSPTSPKSKQLTKVKTNGGVRDPNVTGFSMAIAHEINTLRSNPGEYLKKLTARFQSFIDDYLYQLTEDSCVKTREGKQVVLETINVLSSMKPLKPMEVSPFLEASAMDHASDLIINNRFSDDGSDGSTLSDRMERYCVWRGTNGENIAYGINSASDIILSLLIDDGVPSRGHRKNLLNPEFLTVGAAIGPHPQHSYCCVMDFVTKALSFEAVEKENITDVSNISEDILKEVNLMRTSPEKYIPLLQERYDSFVDENTYRLSNELRYQAKEGKDIVMEVIELLRSMKPLPAMSLSSFLESAAFDHCKDSGMKNLVGHDGSDGSTIQTRIERYCEWKGSIGENIDYGMSNARDIVMNLLIDDDEPSRGHRKNLLEPSFLVLGASIGPHPEYSCCCVIDFATKTNSLQQSLDEQVTTVKGISQMIVNEINELRSNPMSYIPYLEQRLDTFIDEFVYKSNDEVHFRTVEGKKLIVETIQMLKTAPSLLPLEVSPFLESSAMDHTRDLGNKGAKGSNNIKLSERIEKHCAWKGAIGAVMEYGSTNIRDIIIELLVDDGKPKRSNRNHILSTDYHYLGAAIGPHPQYDTCCVIDFASRVLSKEDYAAESVKTVRSISNEIMTEINLLRTTPHIYLFKLQSLFESFIDDSKIFRAKDGTRMTTKEGRNAVREAMRIIEAMTPLPPMGIAYTLEQAAKDLALDLGETGGRGHEGSDGSTVSDRIERYCSWRGIIGENIDYGNNNAEDIILSLLVDDGVADRGHRSNLLNPDHLFVGAVLGPYPQFVHHCLCVMDFAQSVIPLSGILRKNLSATLTKVQDLEQEDIKKLCNTVPYAGNMHDEFKGHLEANDEGSIGSTTSQRRWVQEMSSGGKIKWVKK